MKGAKVRTHKRENSINKPGHHLGQRISFQCSPCFYARFFGMIGAVPAVGPLTQLGGVRSRGSRCEEFCEGSHTTLRGARDAVGSGFLNDFVPMDSANGVASTVELQCPRCLGHTPPLGFRCGPKPLV